MSKRTHAEALETKQNILKAAQKVFTQKGFAKASLSDIAREANVTRGAIYWHFENKNELLAALCYEAGKAANLSQFLRAASDENQRDPLGCLKQWALGHFTDDAEVVFSSSIIDIVDSVISSSDNSRNACDAKAKLLELVVIRKYRIEEALRGAIRLMQLPPDVDVELAASLIESTLFGLVNAIRHGTSVKPYSRYNVVIDILFNQLANIKRPSTRVF